MSKQIITVFGATGIQGGSVVNTFLNDSKLKSDWAVRGVTRNASSEKAKALAAQGVEVVSADMNDKASLVKAMTGASAVFGMTNYWEGGSKEAEAQQGKNLADAAKEAGVNHFIYSSLPNTTKLTDGALPNIYHFDSKAEAEEYTRSLGIPASFLHLAVFTSNSTNGMLRQNPYAGDAWTIAMPFAGDRPFPIVDAAVDTGKYVKAMVLRRDEVLGKAVHGFSAVVTGDQMIEGFKKTFPEAGKTAQFQELPHDVFKSFLPGPEPVQEEMLQNMRLMGEYAYYGKDADLESSRALLLDEPTTWEAYLKRTEAYAELK